MKYLNIWGEFERFHILKISLNINQVRTDSEIINLFFQGSSNLDTF